MFGKLRTMRARADARPHARCFPLRGAQSSSAQSRMQSKLIRGHVTFADDDPNGDADADADTAAVDTDLDTWRPVRAHNAIKLAVEQRLASQDAMLASSTIEAQHSNASMRESVLSITQQQQPLASVHSAAVPHHANLEAHLSGLPAMPTVLSGAGGQHLQLQQHLAGLLDHQQASVNLGTRPAMPGGWQHLQRAASDARLTRGLEAQSTVALSSRASSPMSTIQPVQVRCIGLRNPLGNAAWCLNPATVALREKSCQRRLAGRRDKCCISPALVL